MTFAAYFNVTLKVTVEIDIKILVLYGWWCKVNIEMNNDNVNNCHFEKQMSVVDSPSSNVVPDRNN